MKGPMVEQAEIGRQFREKIISQRLLLGTSSRTDPLSRSIPIKIQMDFKHLCTNTQ